ncbi:MAG: transposase [Clostridia bacterium]|nr:transposase [Clostridia bacterium]
MRDQQTFGDIEYNGKKKKTRRELFLEQMEDIVPWKRWVDLIEPYYPKGRHGRPPKGIEVMLRMYLLQVWFSLSDEMMEEAIYDSHSMRKFVGISLLEEDVPDATTLLRFRHLLRAHALAQTIIDQMNEALSENGLLMKKGAIVDAATGPAKSRKKEPRPRIAPGKQE